jgi:predicted TIM-barrel fold metal-dependent hydrolase
MVQEAIERQGFIGVKLYNSLGYKPLGNESVQQYRRTKIPLHRWYGKRRYHRHIKGDDYDRVLTKLYAYCEREGVPITTHCGMYGIEAFPGKRSRRRRDSQRSASWIFGRAEYWREVLDKFPNLHLNLAHFGWNFDAGYDGTDDNGYTSWVQEICDMLVDYTNVYTDVSHHRVLDYPDRRIMKQEYAKMRAAAGDKWDTIKRKILFGIDWHVIKRERNYPSFQSAYTEVMVEGGGYGSTDLGDFLYGNAMRFLGLQFGQANHTRLAAFYQTHNIVPPPWYPRNPPPPTPPGP